MAENAIVCYKGQIAFRGQGQTTCAHHKGIHLNWVCDTCHDVICAKCVFTLHKGHDIILLSEVTPHNKRKIKTFISETEKSNIIKLQQEISSTHNGLYEHFNHFERVSEEVKLQGEKLKENIDILIAETLSQLKYLEEENTKLLIKYKSELEQNLADLEKQLKHCKESLQTGTDIQVFDLSKGLNTNIILPIKPTLGSAYFTPNTSRNMFQAEVIGKVSLVPAGQPQAQPSTCPDQSHGSSVDAIPLSPGQQQLNKWSTKNNKILKEAFGKDILIPSGQFQSKYSTGPDKSDGTSVDAISLPFARQQSQKGSTGTGHDPEKFLLPQVKIQSELKYQYRIAYMRPKSDGGVWMSDGLKVIHLDSQGEIQQEIQSPIFIADITSSPTTHNLWACSSSDESVMELISGELTFRFKIKDEPRCLCVTRDEHILVGTKHRISEYTPEGTPGIAIKNYLFKKPMLRSPQSISQCPINGNIAVVDGDKGADGGKYEPTVIVLDETLQQLYRYGKSQHYRESLSLNFRPWDVTYDSLGHLVVTDPVSKGIHLLIGDGIYLRFINTDKDVPLAVCVDTEGILWAVLGFFARDQKLKRLQYTRV